MILDYNMSWDSPYSACLADNNNIAYLINCANEVYSENNALYRVNYGYLVADKFYRLSFFRFSLCEKNAVNCYMLSTWAKVDGKNMKMDLDQQLNIWLKNSIYSTTYQSEYHIYALLNEIKWHDE